MSPVDLYILEKEPAHRQMLQRLHSLILSCAPKIEARLTYQIPFYYYFGRLCYLNPKTQGVDLGFCRGSLMADNPLLGRTELKEVRIIHFNSSHEIEEELLVPLIYEAMIINEMFKKKG